MLNAVNLSFFTIIHLYNLKNFIFHGGFIKFTNINNISHWL